MENVNQEGLEVIDGINVVRSMFQDDGEAYGQTQWDDRINDGAVFIHRDSVIIMCTAWPVRVCGPALNEFHRLNEDETWDNHEGGKYLKSYELAQKIHERESQTDKKYKVYFDTDQPWPANLGSLNLTEKSEEAALKVTMEKHPDAKNIMIFKE